MRASLVAKIELDQQTESGGPVVSRAACQPYDSRFESWLGKPNFLLPFYPFWPIVHQKTIQARAAKLNEVFKTKEGENVSCQNQDSNQLPFVQQAALLTIIPRGMTTKVRHKNNNDSFPHHE